MVGNLGSLFDGIGGFPLAASRYGIKALWASEIEPWPIKVTEHHFPDMKHLGDLTQISGAEIEPVDIITFGSPCQDLSVAGKRAGLEGQRSGLFMEAVRIIREMRAATDGCFPRYAIWENVPGAYSSNGGQDFRAVLEEIAEAEIPMPTSGKWAEAGMVRTERVDVAWRTLDAQYWGVPQRRKRIFLVADFAGQCAGEILFVEQGLSGDSQESGETGQEVAAAVGDGVAKSSGIIPFDTTQMTSPQNGSNPQPGDPCHPLCATAHVPSVAIPVENHPADSRVNIIEDGKVQTLTSRMGTGGGNVPMIMEQKNPAVAYGIDQQGGKGQANFEIDKVPTLCSDSHGTPHAVAFQPGNLSRQAGADPSEKVFPTLGATTLGDQFPCVAFAANQRDEVRDLGDKSGALQAEPGMKQQTFIARTFQNTGQGWWNESEVAATVRTPCGGDSIKANLVGYSYAVRRLTPLECTRLQGFPDDWLDIEGMSDTAKYKAVGNSVAVPCVEFVMSGIAKVMKEGNQCR